MQDSFRIEWVEMAALQEGLVVGRPRLARKGQVVIGRYSERFYAPLDIWGVQDYEEQWIEARRRFCDGASSTCFVVSVHPPGIASFVETWTVWRLAEQLRIQNKCYWGFSEMRDMRRLYEEIPEYSNITEDGEVMLDWEMSSGALE